MSRTHRDVLDRNCPSISARASSQNQRTDAALHIHRWRLVILKQSQRTTCRCCVGESSPVNRSCEKKPSDCNLIAEQRPTFHRATDTERSNTKKGSLLVTECLEETEQRYSTAWRPEHLHHTGIENTLRSHPPWHSAGPYVSSEVYPLVVLPFYCCHYQGNLGEAKGSCYLINNAITELKIKHFKMWHQVTHTNTCISKTPQLSWLLKRTANVRTIVSKQAVIKSSNGL